MTQETKQWSRVFRIGAIGAFAFFQKSTLGGFLAMDPVYVVINVIVFPVLLALYIAMRESNESMVAIAGLLTFVGLIALFASNPAGTMYELTQGYAKATTLAQKQLYLAAGQATMSNMHGSSYHVHLIVGSIGLLLFALYQWGHPTFSKVTAMMGILANTIAFGYYVPVIGIYLLLFSVLFMNIWYIMMGMTLWGLSKQAGS